MIIKDTNENKLDEIIPENIIDNKISLPNAMNTSVTQKPEGIQKIESTYYTNNYLFIKSKFYKGPTLEKYIEKQKGYENENKIELVLKHFLQIVIALKNLHEKNYVHLDLKSDNLIFTDENCKKLIIIDDASMKRRIYSTNF